MKKLWILASMFLLLTVAVFAAPDISGQCWSNCKINGNNFNGTGNFNFKANVFDVSNVTKLEFVVDGKLNRTESTAPYFMCGDNNGVGYDCPASFDSYHNVTIKVYNKTNGMVYQETFFLNVHLKNSSSNASNSSNQSNQSNVSIYVPAEYDYSSNVTLRFEMDNDVTVAYISDLGIWEGWDKVGKMLNKSIINGELDLIVINGDLGQAVGVSPWTWNKTFNKYVPLEFPVVITMGNHECQDHVNYTGTSCPAWDMIGGSKEIVKQRMYYVVQAGGVLNLSDDGRRYSLNFKGLRIIGLDANLVGSGGKYLPFLSSELDKKMESRTVCSWHYELPALSLSGESYPNLVPVGIYQDCLNNGAVIYNGHKHYYVRTMTLSSFLPVSLLSNFSKDEVHVGNNYTYYSIMAVGGMDIIDHQTASLSNSTPSSYPYSCNWLAHADMADHDAPNGAVYITYNVNSTLGKDWARYISADDGTFRDEYYVINDNLFKVELPVNNETNSSNSTNQSADDWWNSLSQSDKLTIMGKYVNGTCTL